MARTNTYHIQQDTLSVKLIKQS